VYCIILGSCFDTIPLCLNGAIGADLHVPFPVALRSSFGYYLSRFGVVVRMITALFWHGVSSLAQVISEYGSQQRSDPNIHWLHGTHAVHQSNLAVVSGHTKPYSRKHWDHQPATCVSFSLLEHSIPNPPHSPAQAQMVLHLQSGGCHCDQCCSRHCDDRQGWWHRRHMEAGLPGLWRYEILAHLVEHV
jgi:hypothetical protein